MPVYDVSDAVATVVEADREIAWQALLDVDLLTLGREAPLVGMLGVLRILPEVVGHLLHGERSAKPPESMRLRDLSSIPMYEAGWMLLGERAGEEFALGLLGKFWRPVIEFARIGSAAEFREFDEPGFAKTVYDLSARELDSNRVFLTTARSMKSRGEAGTRPPRSPVPCAEPLASLPDLPGVLPLVRGGFKPPPHHRRESATR